VGNKALPCVFLDIAKAFDSVHHGSLLLKLSRLGITDHLWWFVRAFLKDRWCAIWGDGAVSDWFVVGAGVPQGSVLAPLLYAIFINDLVPIVIADDECDCCLFADDVNIWSQKLGVEGIRQLARCLVRVTKWADTWRVRFGQKKCSLVLFGRGKHTADGMQPDIDTLTLTCFRVERVQSYTFLGVKLDERLRWREQAAAVKQRASLAAYNIAKLIRSGRPPGPDIIARLCRAVLLPTMYYGLALWRPTQKDSGYARYTLLALPLWQSLD
jgi:hypothetical protein